ncbi:MAG: hypothetical protein JXR58_10965 [Bacteroidales bacterium]|nr:hypothetical protein [Bacteroidales bacterium]
MKTLLLLFFSVFVMFSAQSQSIEFTKENFDDVDGLKEALKNIKEGDKLFAKKNAEFYPAALEFYQKAQDFNARNSILNFKMGVCYLGLYGSEDKALDYFLNAKKLDKNVDIKIDYAIGQAYQARGEYDMAVNSYNIYLNGLEPEDREEVQSTVDSKIRECMKAMETEVAENNSGNEVKSEEVNNEEEAIVDNYEDNNETEEEEDNSNNNKQGKTGESNNNETSGNEVTATSNSVTDDEPKYDIYKVQIGTSKKQLSLDELHAIYNGEYPIEVMFIENEYKYYIGAFTSKDQAIKLKESCGVSGAFVVGKSAENDYVAVSGASSGNQNSNTNQNTITTNSNTSNNNVVIDKDGVIFKVQISSNASRQSQAELMKVYSGNLKIEEMQIDGLFKYMLGNETSYHKALEIKKNCEVDGCFIVGFKDGKKISDIRPYIK